MKEMSKSDFIIILIMLGVGTFMFVFGLVTNAPTGLIGATLMFGSVVYAYQDKRERPNKPYDYMTHGDFKKYYDNKMKRNIWVLGYFGGGGINISDAEILAKEYAFRNDCKYNEVKIDEIFTSRRFKGFKYIYSTTTQFPEIDADCSDDVFGWLTD